MQSFFRGWLCRRRWKQIVDEYINSPHAESMRKRNSLVFSMVEFEEDYCEMLEVLVSCFLRPLKMAASSKRPPLTHEDVNSIFLNSETVLFLHQIFLKGLTSRLESWPTLVLGLYFDDCTEWFFSAFFYLLVIVVFRCCVTHTRCNKNFRFPRRFI